MKSLFSLIVTIALLVYSIHSQEDGFDGENEEMDSNSYENSLPGSMDDPYSSGGGGMNNPYGGGMDPYGGGGGMDPYGGGYGGGEGGGYGGGGGPPSIQIKELDTLIDINNFIGETNDQTVVIGYFDPLTNENDFKIFKQLSELDSSLGYIRYGYTTNKQVLEDKKYDGCAVMVHLPSKFVIAKDEKPKARYPSKTISSLNTLRLFVRSKSVPLVGEVTIKSEKAYRLTKLPVVTIFTSVDHDKNPKGFQYVVNRVKKVAKNFKNKVLFNIANTNDFKPDMEEKYNFPKSADNKGIMVGLREGTMYYTMSGVFSVDTLTDFITAFKAGTLTSGVDQMDSELNEEDEPQKVQNHDEAEEETDESSSKVVTLTNSNFKDTVYETEADVLLEFYAPWCGHCKQLKPEYKQLADMFEKDSNIIIAALDATANEVPSGFDVQGYPTLIFVPGNDKSHPIPYDGDRDAISMAKYIDKHRTSTPSTSEEL